MLSYIFSMPDLIKLLKVAPEDNPVKGKTSGILHFFGCVHKVIKKFRMKGTSSSRRLTASDRYSSFANILIIKKLNHTKTIIAERLNIKHVL